MRSQPPLTPAQFEEKIQKAIVALQLKEYKSIRKAAEHFEVPKSTLADRLAGKKTRTQTHEMAQILSNAEENTLVRWISRLTVTGFPATPMLVKEMADEIRIRRVQVASSQNPTFTNTPPIGHEWIYRFQKRHPELKGCYSRQLESNRAKEATSEKIQAWFDAFQTRHTERKYELADIYNMDETGFAVGGTQSTRIIVDSTQKSNWKVTAGKQEWITVLECVSAAGEALPPMIIFKAQNTNSAWVPKDTPRNWQFSTSTSGWTSNSHGFEWLRTVFEPESKKVSGDRPRLLIMDGHSSHITGDLIALCIEKDIDLLILPPHCSHLLQPLDVGVYGPMKRYHALEVDRYSRVGVKRIQRAEWVELFQRIRAKALIPSNIKAGWRGAGLVPFLPRKVLDTLPFNPLQPPSTPQIRTISQDLDLSVLRSSPPDGTELRQANQVFNSALAGSDSPASPTRRYAKRMTRLVESQNAEITLLRKQLADAQEVIETRKKRTKGKRIKLQGQFVFSTEEVLKIVREAEEKPKEKKPRGRPRKRPIEELEEDIEEKELENSSSDSELELDECVARRTRSKVE
jgi:DDE superfamily endonuclease/Tc5 transposase DNA-binding domain/helix-turn-helix, Psq domain